MSGLDLLQLVLASWYFSYVLTHTSGFGGVFVKLRAVDPTGVTRCIYCVGFWIALALYALTFTPLAPLVTVGAGVGGALLLHKYVGYDYDAR